MSWSSRRGRVLARAGSQGVCEFGACHLRVPREYQRCNEQLTEVVRDAAVSPARCTAGPRAAVAGWEM
jgi:hypothetical protein